MEVLREKIAEIVQECVERNVIAARNRDRTTLTSTEAADRILALSEIAEALKRLRLPERQGMTEFEYAQAIAEQKRMLGHTSSGTREPE